VYCLDCLSGERERAVVGVCHSCGAGVCIDHAAILPVHLVRMGVIMREERVDPPARQILCPTCLAARRAAGGPAPQRHGHHDVAADFDGTGRPHTHWWRGAPSAKVPPRHNQTGTPATRGA